MNARGDFFLIFKHGLIVERQDVIVEELVGADGPKKVPVVEQLVVHLVEALQIAQLPGGPLAVLRRSVPEKHTKSKVKAKVRVKVRVY